MQNIQRNLDYGNHASDTNEGETAKNTLLVMAKDLYDLYVSLNDSDDLPEWCHYKLATSKSELSSVTDYLTSKIMKMKLDSYKITNEIQLESSQKIFLSESFFSKLLQKFKKNKSPEFDYRNNITKPISKPDLTFQNKDTIQTTQTLNTTAPVTQSNLNNTNSTNAISTSNSNDQLYEDTANEVVQALVNIKFFSKLILDYKKIQEKTPEIKSELSSSSYNDDIMTVVSNMERIFVMLFSSTGYYYVLKKLYENSLNLREAKEEKDIVKLARVLMADSGIALNKKYSLLPQIMQMSDEETTENLLAAANSLSIKSMSELQKLLSRYLNVTIVCGKIIKEILDSNPEQSNVLDSVYESACHNYNYEVNSRKPKIKQIKYSQFKSSNFNPYVSIVSSLMSINNFYIKYFDDNITNFESVTNVYRKQKRNSSQRLINKMLENFSGIEKDLSLAIKFIDEVIKDYNTLKESPKQLKIYSFSQSLIRELTKIKGFPEKKKIAYSYIQRTSNKTRLMLLSDLSKYISSEAGLVEELLSIKKNFEKIHKLIIEIKSTLERK